MKFTWCFDAQNDDYCCCSMRVIRADFRFKYGWFYVQELVILCLCLMIIMLWYVMYEFGVKKMKFESCFMSWCTCIWMVILDDEFFMSSWWVLYEFLMSSWWVLYEFFMSSWWVLYEFFIVSLWFLYDSLWFLYDHLWVIFGSWLYYVRL